MSEKKYPIKWEYKSHSYPIGDTGDYDGYWEVTNGKDSLITKEDYEDIEKDLQAVVDILNNTYANFTFDRNIEAALEAENKWLKSELEQHKAETSAVWAKASDRLPEDHNTVHWRRAEDKCPLLIVGYNYQNNIIAQFGRVYCPEALEWLDESGSEAKKALEG